MTTVHERSDADVRELEGLPPVSGPVAGAALAGPPPSAKTICKSTWTSRTATDGFYLDQRDNRALVQALSKNAAVLNCFATPAR